MNKYKFEKQFREENPQTIGETDRHFDLDNYKDWLESKLSWICVDEKLPTELDIFFCKTHSEIEDDILYFVAIYDPKTERWYSELNKLDKNHECNVTHYRVILP
jgi:hypothetical protein